VNSLHPDPAADFLQRLAAVEVRLRDLSRKRLDGRTDPDSATGESWDAGQIWAHLADFVPYWISQVERVLAADSPDPVPFGRARANADHPAMERDRSGMTPRRTSATSEPSWVTSLSAPGRPRGSTPPGG
jgi:hypothetical protein